jgi:hypothetical protein
MFGAWRCGTNGIEEKEEEAAAAAAAAADEGKGFQDFGAGRRLSE